MPFGYEDEYYTQEQRRYTHWISNVQGYGLIKGVFALYKIENGPEFKLLVGEPLPNDYKTKETLDKEGFVGLYAYEGHPIFNEIKPLSPTKPKYEVIFETKARM